MALKHDAQGFLVGDPIDLGRLVEEWAAIKDDVRAIRRAIVGGGQANISGQASSRVVPIAAVPRAVAGRQRLAAPLEPAIPNSGFSGAARRESDGAVIAMRQAAAALRATQAATLRAPAEPARRDSRGRFVAGQTANQKKPGKRPGDDPRDNEEREEGLIRSISERVGGAFKEAGTGLEEADPAVKAISEIAQPVARGFELMSGGDPQKKQERWLRRIFTTLTGSRKEQGLFNKIAAKRLKAIEEKPEEKSGGGIFGGLLDGLGGALMKIPVIGSLLSAGGAAAGGVGKLLLGGGKGLLRKIPILGGLLASLGAASDIYSAETDDTLTRGEKDKRTGKAAGGLAGTLGGLWAGAKLGAAVGALGGPIGAAIGGVVGGAAGMFFGDRAGQVVGQTVGGWVSDLREADIGGMIAQKWDSTVERFSTKWDDVSERFSTKWNELTDGLKGKWDDLVGDLKGLWGDITSAAEEAFDWVKKKGDQANDYVKGVTGVDVKEAARAAVTSTKEVAASAIASVKSAGNAANDYVKDATGVDIKASAGKAVSTAKEGAAQIGDKAAAAKDWIGDKITDRSGKNKDALIAEMGRSGITDPKEQAMFMAQMDHESGGFKSYEENLNYSAAGLRKTFGKYFKTDAEAQAAARNPEMIANKVYGGRMGNVDPGDGYKFRGRGAIQLTGRDNYTRAGEALGLDLVNNPDLAKDPENAAKIAAWYWKSRNVGEAARAGNVEAATRKINGGLNGIGDRRDKYDKYVAQANAGEFSSGQAPGPVQTASASTPYSMQARREVETRLRTENEERVRRNLEAAGQTTPMMEQERALAAAQGGTGSVASPSAPTAPVVTSAAIPAAVSLAAPAEPAVAVASVPAVPSAPATPPIADAPPVSVPMASNDTRKPVAVVSPSPEVGQDLRERGIAHIATGGLGKG